MKGVCCQMGSICSSRSVVLGLNKRLFSLVSNAPKRPASAF